MIYPAEDWNRTAQIGIALNLTTEGAIGGKRSDLESGGVSIIIPCYNAAATLGTTIASALAQDVPVEVIVVDDGSSDSSLAVARTFEPAVRVIAGPNRGASAARNRGNRGNECKVDRFPRCGRSTRARNAKAAVRCGQCIERRCGHLRLAGRPRRRRGPADDRRSPLDRLGGARSECRARDCGPRLGQLRLLFCIGAPLLTRSAGFGRICRSFKMRVSCSMRPTMGRVSSTRLTSELNTAFCLAASRAAIRHGSRKTCY